MKQSLLVVLICSIVQLGFGQTWYSVNGGALPADVEYHIHTMVADISPISEPHLFGTNEMDSTNSWVYGQTTKPYFNFETGWVTDSVNAYGDSLRSELVVKIPTMFGHQTSWLLFEHKYRTELNNDGGFLEYSCDSLHWNLVRDYDAMDEHPPMGIIPINFGQNVHDTVPGFSGIEQDWVWSGVQFIWWYSVFQTEEIRDFVYCEWDNFDTIYVRFVFESDSISTGDEGWIIRNMMIGHDDFPGMINDHSSTLFDIFPNPASSIVHVRSKLQGIKPQSVTICDMTGRQILSSSYQEQLDVSWLAGGNYLLTVLSEERAFRQILVKE